MFANRFTALVDACSLVGTLKRNLLLTLAESEFFRVRWSETILQEAEKAIAGILAKKGFADAEDRAARARAFMETAFEEAIVSDFDRFLSACSDLPDPNDAHVVAAALKIQASTIVSENVRHFPDHILRPLNLDVRSADTFIADTIALDEGKAVHAVRRMRERLQRPEKSAKRLLLDMEANGLTSVVDILKPHEGSL